MRLSPLFTSLDVLTIWTVVLGLVVGIWLGRGREPAAPTIATDVQMLAPYVVSGAQSEDVATTLLAGRFAEVKSAASIQL